MSAVAVIDREPQADYDVLFRAEYPRVLRVCQALLRDRERAEDVTQEAFIRLYTHWHRVASYDRPDAWVRRVAVRLAVRTAKRDRRRTWLERETATGQGQSTATPTTDVFAIAATLPRQQQLAVVLHYVDDLPMADVAAAMGCAEPTARVHLHRARRRLGELLAGQVAHD